MKVLSRCAPLFLVLAIMMSSGCDLKTITPQLAATQNANHLVINEVFTLPESSMNPYSWLELFNPTQNRIGGLNRWTLTYTYHWKSALRDTMFRVTANLESAFPMYTIPDTLEPGQFLVLIGDSIHFYNHTNLGPGKGTATTFIPFATRADSNFGFRGALLFFLQESDELVLRDTSGVAVDVVRYGNYVPPAPDLYPGNQSAGNIPEWSSLSRYAGAYATGNSANDFYIESKPIPMWYSELHHP